MNGVAVPDFRAVRRVKQGSPSTPPIQGDEMRALRRRQRRTRLNLRNLCTAFPLVEVR
jgi:hypothetical protein